MLFRVSFYTFLLHDWAVSAVGLDLFGVCLFCLFVCCSFFYFYFVRYARVSGYKLLVIDDDSSGSCIPALPSSDNRLLFIFIVTAETLVSVLCALAIHSVDHTTLFLFPARLSAAWTVRTKLFLFRIRNKYTVSLVSYCTLRTYTPWNDISFFFFQ